MERAVYSRNREERRDHPKLIRYSVAELELVTQRARDCGRPVARYIRETSLGAVPRARRTAMSDVVIRQLARVANRLTQLSRLATEQQIPGAAEFESTVGDVLEVIRVLE
jgi:hypothetical protein